MGRLRNVNTRKPPPNNGSQYGNRHLQEAETSLSDRAFPNNDSHRAVGLEYAIVDHTADGIMLQVTAGIDPLASD